MCRSSLTFRTVLICTAIFAAVSQAQYSNGDGTSENPFRIGTVSDWLTLINRSGDWDKHFILKADLDMQGEKLSPVGSYSRHFTGVFNGNSHTIRNVVIEQPNSDYIGLFGFLGQNGRISNLIVENADIKGRDYVGALAGTILQGEVNNCHVTGSVGGRERVGGLVGYTQNSTLLGCSAIGPVIGTASNIGGLVGYNDQGSLTACSASGLVTASYDDAGGLVGYSEKALFTACSASGQVRGRDYLGGLVGYNYESPMNDCRATGSVDGRESVGGLVGYTQNSTVHGCSASGPVTGTGSNIGGLVGQNIQGSLTTCSASGSVTASYDDAGGLVGYSEKALFTACSASGQVSGEDYVGGVVGYNSDCNLLACSYTGQVNGTGSSVGGLLGNNIQGIFTTCSVSGIVNGGSYYVGGLVGSNYGGSFIACSSDGSVSGIYDYIGGLVGANSGGSVNDCNVTSSVNGRAYVGGMVGYNSDCNLFACSYTGQVNGTGSSVGGLLGNNIQGIFTTCSVSGIVNGGSYYVGGLVGSNYGGDFTACSSDGSVSGRYDYIGGLVGANSGGSLNDCNAASSVINGRSYVGGMVGYNSFCNLSACYSVGYVVETASNVGGLVGYDSGSVELKPNFWDIDTSGQTKSALGTGKKTEEMQDPNTFIAAGWDFLGESENGIAETWTIRDVNYPELCWQVYYRIAYAPNPPDGADYLDPNVTLSWIPSITAARHDVYLDDQLIGSPNEPNLTVAGLVPGTTHFWRVDEVNDADPNSPWTGTTWSFTVPLKTARNPYPADGVENVVRNVVLAWTPGYGAKLHTVYFGKDCNEVSNATGGIPQEPNTYDPGVLDSNETYCWRVDEFDGSQTHKGNTWSFTVELYVETWTGKVSASKDDGYAIREGLQNLDFDFLRVGSSPSSDPPYYASGMVFRDVNVPQGVRVINARLKICSYNERLTDAVYGTIQAQAADKAASFNEPPLITERPRTDASVDWDHVEGWTPDTWYESPDIAKVIQEVISRDGWSEGNSLAVFYSTRQRKGGFRQFSSYDRGADFASVLEITYEP